MDNKKLMDELMDIRDGVNKVFMKHVDRLDKVIDELEQKCSELPSTNDKKMKQKMAKLNLDVIYGVNKAFMKHVDVLDAHVDRLDEYGDEYGDELE